MFARRRGSVSKACFTFKTWAYFLSIYVTDLAYIQVRRSSILGSVAAVSSRVSTKFLAVLNQEFVYR